MTWSWCTKPVTDEYEDDRGGQTNTAGRHLPIGILLPMQTAIYCFCSALKELIFNSLSFSEMISSWSVWSAIILLETLCYFLSTRETYHELFTFCQLSVIGHILTNQVLRCWAEGRFESSKKSLKTVLSRLAFFPTRPYHPVSPSSLPGQRHLRSR